MEQLKPCPFCGKKQFFKMQMEPLVFCVGCERCDARVFGIDEESAIKRWNKRHGAGE